MLLLRLWLLWLMSMLISAEGIGLGRGMCAAAGGVRKVGDVGEVGSLVSSPESRLPSADWVCVNVGQFHLTELWGLCTSTLVLALVGQAELIDDGGRSGSLTVSMVSVAELRREHGVEGRSPLYRSLGVEAVTVDRLDACDCMASEHRLP